MIWIPPFNPSWPATHKLFHNWIELLFNSFALEGTPHHLADHKPVTSCTLLVSRRVWARMWDSRDITTNILIIQKKKHLHIFGQEKLSLWEHKKNIITSLTFPSVTWRKLKSIGFLIYNALSQMQCINSNFSVILGGFPMKNYWQCDYWKEVKNESSLATINLSKYLVSFLNSGLLSSESTRLCCVISPTSWPLLYTQPCQSLL